MTGIVIVVVALVCLLVGFMVGRRNGIEAEMRRQQLHDRDRY